MADRSVMQQKIKSALDVKSLKNRILNRRRQWKDVGVFSFFLLLALVFWCLQSIRQNHEQAFDAPLRNINMPSENGLVEPAETFMEKKLQLTVKCPDVPAGYVLRILPSSVEATFNVTREHFKELTDKNIAISLPFREFKQHQSTGWIPVQLTLKPSWITEYVLVPNEIEFIIEQVSHD